MTGESVPTMACVPLGSLGAWAPASTLDIVVTVVVVALLCVTVISVFLHGRA